MAMKFQYFDGPQKSPEWFQLRIGKITASVLWRWLSVSKKDGVTPLKERLDYEGELMFERKFNRSFEKFVTGPMQDGVTYEPFVRTQYEKIKNVVVQECGAWHNKYFVASPDGMIGKDGLLEVKVLKDNSFTDVLTHGVPDDHWKQIQGQLFAAGRDWCDYVAMNMNTQKLKIIRVFADEEFFKKLEKSLKEPLTVPEMAVDGVYDLVDELPGRGELGQVFEMTITKETLISQSDSNIEQMKGW